MRTSTQTKEALVIYWSRRDLRLHDNRALTEAITASKETAAPLVPLFIVRG
jgi:deoxyribodipyrimidine photolyase